MKYLLDTNVLSEPRKAKSGKADPNVLAWFGSVAEFTLYVSTVTLMELELGVLLMERRDQSQGTALRRWLRDQVIPEFADRTLSFDPAIALRCAILHVPDRRPDRDAMIAATALVHDLTVVTRNVRDFEGTGVALLNPWEG